MYVRTTCAVKANKVSPELIQKLEELGITPIITPQVVRRVYEGTDEALGKKIVTLFQQEKDPEIYYDDGRRGRHEATLQCQNQERAGAQSSNVMDKKHRKQRVRRSRG